jgi:hypothetical protein
MNRDRKRALTAAYKERKPRPGVFAVRCVADGQTWVGASRELANRQNGIWFALRLGTSLNKGMQQAWRGHGEAAFTYEELQVIGAEDLSAWSLDQALKAAAADWREQLGAGIA